MSNESGCSNKALFTHTEIWILYIFHASRNILFLGGYYFQIFINAKSIFSLQAALKQLAGQIWPEGCGIPFIDGVRTGKAKPWCGSQFQVDPWLGLVTRREEGGVWRELVLFSFLIWLLRCIHFVELHWRHAVLVCITHSQEKIQKEKIWAVCGFWLQVLGLECSRFQALHSCWCLVSGKESLSRKAFLLCLFCFLNLILFPDRDIQTGTGQPTYAYDDECETILLLDHRKMGRIWVEMGTMSRTLAGIQLPHSESGLKSTNAYKKEVEAETHLAQ